MSKAVMLLTLGEAHEPVDSYGTSTVPGDRPSGPTVWVGVGGSQEGSLEEVMSQLRREGRERSKQVRWGRWGAGGCFWPVSQHKQELGGCREQGVDKQVDTAPQAQRGGGPGRGE